MRSSPVIAPPSFVATIFLRIVGLRRQTGQLLGERVALRELCRALQQRLANSVDPVHIEAQIAQQLIDAHGGVKFQLAIGCRESGARIERHLQLGGVRLFAARQFHRVSARHHSRPTVASPAMTAAGGTLRGFRRMGHSTRLRPRRLFGAQAYRRAFPCRRELPASSARRCDASSGSK